MFAFGFFWVLYPPGPLFTHIGPQALPFKYQFLLIEKSLATRKAFRDVSWRASFIQWPVHALATSSELLFVHGLVFPHGLSLHVYAASLYVGLRFKLGSPPIPLNSNHPHLC